MKVESYSMNDNVRNGFPDSPTGTVMYYFSGLVVAVAPLTMLKLPWWLSVILIVAEFFNPWPIFAAIIMLVLYGWSFCVSICSPFQEWLSAYYYLSLIAVVSPMIIALIKRLFFAAEDKKTAGGGFPPHN